MHVPGLSPVLPAGVLARRAALPLKPSPVALEGRWVTLVPLEAARHTEALHAASNGQPFRLGARSIGPYDAEALVWRYLFDGPFETADGLRARLDAQAAAPNTLAFCALDGPTGQPVGVALLMNNAPADLKIELGGIWYSPIVQGTPVNTEATCLMLGHVFALGYRRAEWKCHSANERSRRTALRMGFTFEGIQQAHMIVKDRSRDTAWYRVLVNEWPGVRGALERTLDAWAEQSEQSAVDSRRSTVDRRPTDD